MRSLLPILLLAAACAPPGPTAGPVEAPKPVDVAVAPAAADAGEVPVVAAPPEPVDAGAKAESEASIPEGGDPARGKFTLAEATAGLPETGALVATIKTSQGNLTCRLFDDKAPNTVANFVGLARGVRPWREPGGAWVKRPAYDGTTFHRVIRGFMIQGGDPKGTGTGEPGYTIPDELWAGAKHDRAGLLCMANRGPDTNGAQFFITDAAAPHLDGSAHGRRNAYTIFGECAPLAVVHAIARVPTGPSDRPTSDVVISAIEITRKATPASKTTPP